MAFILRLFDFNDAGSLAYDEVLVALLSVLTGAVLATRRGRLPQDCDLEPHVDACFRGLDRDAAMRLPVDALDAWFHRRVGELCAARGLEFCDSPTALLLCFDLVSANMVPPRGQEGPQNSRKSAVELAAVERGRDMAAL